MLTKPSSAWSQQCEMWSSKSTSVVDSILKQHTEQPGQTPIKGACAKSAQSAYLDSIVKASRTQVLEGVNDPYVGWFPHIHGTADRKGASPDGGIYTYARIPVLAVEAKHQGSAGNAIERWFANERLINYLYPSCSFLTFATGEGALEGNVIPRTLGIAHESGFNTIDGTSNSCILSPDGFTPAQVHRLIVAKLTAIIDELTHTTY